MYGKAGAFRPKPYGMEYRVLSNFWLTSDVHMGNVFHLVSRAAIRVVKEQSYINKMERELDHKICDIINQDKYQTARRACGEYHGV